MEEEQETKKQLEMNRTELVFVPAPFFSHLVPTFEFAKLLINREPRISITILLMNTLFAPPDSDAYVKSLLESEPNIKLINLPEPEPPSPELLMKCIEMYVYEYVENYKLFVKHAVGNLVMKKSNSRLVLDFLCNSMIDVGNELGLPSYLFQTSNASFFGLQFYLKTKHMQKKIEFKDSDPAFVIPTFVNPIPPRVLPTPFFSEEGLDVFIKLAKRLGDAKGIIVNTFKELESHAIISFLDGETETPPIYPVGPVLNLKNSRAYKDIMDWLDDQPTNSVVYLCFGSAGGFGAPQMEQIAIGLENTGLRFLWAINKGSTAIDNLPMKFLERTKGRGMICDWAPQVEVLAHKAIRAFVSHCGWNSILESLWYGVPMVTWPLFAEQQFNAFLMVKELELAVEMKLDYRIGGDLVLADEIEKAIRCVMDGDGAVRRRVKEMRENSRKAVMDGGSSFNYIGRLIEDMKRK